MWNSLAGLVVEAETLGVFKTRLDTVCDAIRLLGKLSSRCTLVVVKGWMSCSCHYVMFHHSILSLFRWKGLRICWVCPCRTWSRWRTTPVSRMWMRTRTPCCSVQSSSFCSTWSCTSWMSRAQSRVVHLCSAFWDAFALNHISGLKLKTWNLGQKGFLN